MEIWRAGTKNRSPDGQTLAQDYTVPSGSLLTEAEEELPNEPTPTIPWVSPRGGYEIVKNVWKRFCITNIIFH